MGVHLSFWKIADMHVSLQGPTALFAALIALTEGHRNIRIVRDESQGVSESVALRPVESLTSRLTSTG